MASNFDDQARALLRQAPKRSANYGNCVRCRRASEGVKVCRECQKLGPDRVEELETNMKFCKISVPEPEQGMDGCAPGPDGDRSRELRVRSPPKVTPAYDTKSPGTVPQLPARPFVGRLSPVEESQN